MKIAMDLSKPPRPPLKAPSPDDAALFDLFQELGSDEAVFRRVAVDQSHNALSMADQFPDAPHIEPGIGSGKAMDLGQIIAENVGPGAIDLGEDAPLPQPDQVLKISLSLDILHQDKGLFDLSKRKEGAVPLKAPHVDRARMAGEPIESGMAP